MTLGRCLAGHEDRVVVLVVLELVHKRVVGVVAHAVEGAHGVLPVQQLAVPAHLVVVMTAHLMVITTKH